MPDGVLRRTAFAVCGGRTGTSERVAPIGFDLSERGHGWVVRFGTVGSNVFPISAVIRDRGNRVLLRTIWYDFRPGSRISINGYRLTLFRAAYMALDGFAAAVGLCLLPEPPRDRHRIDLGLLPPSGIGPATPAFTSSTWHRIIAMPTKVQQRPATRCKEIMSQAVLYFLFRASKRSLAGMSRARCPERPSGPISKKPSVVEWPVDLLIGEDLEPGIGSHNVCNRGDRAMPATTSVPNL
jgi:hypothetical protein